MTEMELRSMFASIVPCRETTDMSRDWDCWFPIIFTMRRLEGNDNGTYETREGGRVWVKGIEVDI